MPSSASDLLHKAERYCQKNQQRLTPNRREVLSVLVHQKAPMSAYEILEAMRPNQPQVKPPTVYRALKFLVGVGLIHNVESTSRYLVCNHLGHHHQPQLMVCHQCQQVQEVPLPDTMLAQLSYNAAQVDFMLSHHAIELHGLCSQCASGTY
jgi:Fur family zinc uptake transcriptional regulator